MRVDYIIDCINKVNKEFVKGTWNFSHERNFQCLLFAYLRKSPSSRVKVRKNETVELVHADFNSPATPDADTYLDIGIMEEKSAREFRRLYIGIPEKARNRDLSLKAAIEIKFLYESPKRKFEEIEKDLRKLKMLLRPRKKLSRRCYFLLYIDKPTNKTWIVGEQIANVWATGYWRKTCQTFKKATKGHSELEVCCVFGKQNWQCWFSGGKPPTWEIVDSSLN